MPGDRTKTWVMRAAMDDIDPIEQLATWRAELDRIRIRTENVHKLLGRAHEAVRAYQDLLRDLSRREDELTNAIFDRGRDSD